MALMDRLIQCVEACAFEPGCPDIVKQDSLIAHPLGSFHALGQ
jgi:hypothetical protein